MIVITGANGKLGRAITRRLLESRPADHIGISVRDPAQSVELAELGVRVRRGDFADAGSPAESFDGASQILIVSAGATGDTAVRLNQTAIQAAKQAGVERILYTSHMGASATSLFAPMPIHAASEQALRESGVVFTSLRNGSYTNTVLRLLGGAAQTGELALPEDGPISWTAHADLADAAVSALTGTDLNGITPALTAAESLDMTEVAAVVSELVGREVRRRTVSDEGYRTHLVAHGAPESAADFLIGMFRASRRGEFAEINPTLAQVLGHP